MPQGTALVQIVLGPPKATKVYDPGTCFDMSQKDYDEMLALKAIRQPTQDELMLAGFVKVPPAKTGRAAKAAAKPTEATEAEEEDEPSDSDGPI